MIHPPPTILFLNVCILRCSTWWPIKHGRRFLVSCQKWQLYSSVHWSSHFSWGTRPIRPCLKLLPSQFLKRIMSKKWIIFSKKWLWREEVASSTPPLPNYSWRLIAVFGLIGVFRLKLKKEQEAENLQLVYNFTFFKLSRILHTFRSRNKQTNRWTILAPLTPSLPVKFDGVRK